MVHSSAVKLGRARRQTMAVNQSSLPGGGSEAKATGPNRASSKTPFMRCNANACGGSCFMGSMGSAVSLGVQPSSNIAHSHR